MVDLPYIIAAYSATWLVLMGYALYLTIRSRRVTASAPGARPLAPPPEPPDV